MMIEQANDAAVKLKRIFVESKLPDELRPLKRMANNLWWSWNSEATELFRSIDPEKWESVHQYNPIALLEDGLSWEKAQQLIEDKAFMERMHRVNEQFEAYMATPLAPDQPRIAYFCMEYGLHISMRLYSGGLGILAGDYLKEASDQNAALVGVGLLYRFGYFQQSISLYGDQISEFPSQKYNLFPMELVRDAEGNLLHTQVSFPGRTVYAQIWKMNIGRISLYLLDTDIEGNQSEDRTLTHQLYGGDNEHRLKQEYLLGIGGIRALRALGVAPDIYHLNEGHAAFINLERLRPLIREEGLTFEQASEVVRASALFTTHTPVPAGHDYFSNDLLKRYLHNYIEELSIPWDTFLALGKINPQDDQEQFSMSHLAIRLSQEVNGVSQLHGKVSQDMFKDLYPGYNSEELHIGYVTNGVHYPSWIAQEWSQLYAEQFGEGFFEHQSDPERWRNIRDVPAERIMSIRWQRKAKLLDYVKAKLQSDLTRRGEKPANIFDVLNSIRDDAFVVGFARRFATYKRAHLLFTDLERLAEIVGQEERPIIFLFAGKAHPADQGGQDLIRQIVQISQREQFLGKVIFLEGYNMEMAKLLVQGVDVWLNTPTRPKEASGTSGVKAALNGVINFSVLDGWWAEGYRPEAGWALPLEKTYEEQRLQDELDAEKIYNTFENEIIPLFFRRNEQDVPEEWVAYIKNTISDVAPHFTMKRMMDDYYRSFYRPLDRRRQQITADHFAKVKELRKWKADIQANWNNITVDERSIQDTDNFSLMVGDDFQAKIRLYLNGVQAEHVGLELVVFHQPDEHRRELVLAREFEIVSQDGHMANYECRVKPTYSGVFEYGIRLFPKHPLLPHRQDFGLMRWL